MGDWTILESDAGRVQAWLARPEGRTRGAVVVLQEIFGVNAHIRAVADGFAGAGFVAIAPALFDPVEVGVELGYDEAGFARGRELVAALGAERAVQVIAAASARLQADGHCPGVVGYCWGGSIAFLANTRLGLPGVSYYGARTEPYLGEALRAPMLFHFGAEDATTPPDYIQRHRDAHPGARVFVYPGAGHAFNRDVDPRHHHPASAAQALARTLDFLAEHTS